MELASAWDVIIQQGPLFAVMALVVWQERKRSEATEARLNALLDNLIKTRAEEAVVLIRALDGATAVLGRVERKLDAAGH